MPAISSDGLPVQRGRLEPSRRTHLLAGAPRHPPARPDVENHAMPGRSTPRTGPPRWSGAASGRPPGRPAPAEPCRPAARAGPARPGPARPAPPPTPPAATRGHAAGRASGPRRLDPPGKPGRVAQYHRRHRRVQPEGRGGREMPQPASQQRSGRRSRARAIADRARSPPRSSDGRAGSHQSRPVKTQIATSRPKNAWPVHAVHGRQQRRDPRDPQAAEHTLADHRDQRQHAQALEPIAAARTPAGCPPARSSPSRPPRRTAGAHARRCTPNGAFQKL